jgi:hypothetical protein
MTGVSKGSWQHILVDSLSKAFDTMWVFTKNGEFQVLIGEKEDVRDTMNLFLYLTTEICNLSLNRLHLDDTFKKKEAFCIGCSMRVAERIHEFYARVVEKMPESCLALAISKEGEILAYMKERFKQKQFQNTFFKIFSNSLSVNVLSRLYLCKKESQKVKFLLEASDLQSGS